MTRRSIFGPRFLAVDGPVLGGVSAPGGLATWRSRSLALAAVTILGLGLLACGSGPGSPDGTRVIVLGFDGLDPKLAQELIDAGRLPHLARLAREGTFQPLETSIPPQSPVAWSDFMTGMDAGGHGIFDFLHRNPDNLIPYSSTSKSPEAGKTLPLGRHCFPLSGGDYESLRRGIPFWQVLEKNDVETTILRMPANFPPSGKATRELTGMGTIDLQGTEGTFSFYTSELFAFAGEEIDGGDIHEVDIYDDVVEAKLYGPSNPLLCEEEKLETPFTVYLDPDRTGVKIELGDQQVVLGLGEWSPWLRVDFEMLKVGAIPLQSLSGIVRMYLKQLEPELELYVSPLDIDPTNQAIPVSHPESFAADLAEATGLFYTEGMPEDTKSITEGVFAPEEFLSQAAIAGSEPIRQFPWVLERFLDRNGGFLFYYLGNVDLTGHIMWRARDPEHPSYDPESDPPYEDLIPTLYEGLDELVGQTLDAAGEDTLVIVMSDHGFTSWRRKFHLNHWLYKNDYLALKDENARDPGLLLNVDWENTKAYGYGFSGLYINQKGRERDGIVPFADRQALVQEIGQKLTAEVDPDTGQLAITELRFAEDYEDRGALDVGPDLVLGYADGYHVDNGSALGEIGEQVYSDNDGQWTGDHIMDHRVVPGVLFTSRSLKKPASRLKDLAASILYEFGISEGFPSAGASPADR